MMPVTVERRIAGEVGSLTWWVDDVMMDEEEREKSNAQPPSALAFARQSQRMTTFAELVRDVDRNKGNVLYTKDWRVIMIDFTRAFRLDHELRYPETLQTCDRSLYNTLRSVPDAEVRRAAGRYLTARELDGVLARRKLIVDRFDRLIRERGEAVVLYAQVCSLQPSSGMAKTSPALDTPLRARLEKLAAFEPQDVPVVSLYLDLTADQHGHDNYDVFLRKAFAERLKAFDRNSAERASLERDVERIETYLADEVNRAANGLAIFAAAGAGEFFEAIQLDAPVDEHWLFVGSVPHIYPLARLIDQYPRYAAVILDTHQARILVFGVGAVEKREQVRSVKTRRSSMGGWSQARYQRRAENFHLHHVKEVVDTLDRIVRADNIQHVIVAGDDVVVPLLREQLPQHLTDKLIDVLKLEQDAGEDDIIAATLEALRQKDAESDAERVRELLDAWQSNGLGVVGPEATLRALEMGQVDELLITGSPQDLKPYKKLPDDAAPGPLATETSSPAPADQQQLKLSDELVTRTQQTGARVRIIEDPGLLKQFGGVGAMLRFRI